MSRIIKLIWREIIIIKYECDMCHKIFDGEDIDEYDIPRMWIKNDFSMPKYSSIFAIPTHLCRDCAKKIAEMMDIVVDK